MIFTILMIVILFLRIRNIRDYYPSKQADYNSLDPRYGIKKQIYELFIYVGSSEIYLLSLAICRLMAPNS